MFVGFFERAMFIIRNPFDAMRAEYTRSRGGQHAGKISVEKFKQKGIYEYQSFLKELLILVFDLNEFLKQRRHEILF